MNWVDGLLPDVSDDVYHGDQASLSSTGARKLLECPARFHYEQAHPQKSTAVFDFGRLAHALVLGEGADIHVVDAPDWRTKAAQTARDEARAAGLLPVLLSELDTATRLKNSVMRHPIARLLFDGGVAERSGYWQDEPTDIRLRFRPDWLTELDGQPVCVDLKTTVSADPVEFVRSIAKFKYHFQAAWYRKGLAALGVDARFLFVAVEKVPPYLVSVIELDTWALLEGDRLNRLAIDLYAECLQTDQWPDYGDNIHTLSLPAWAMRDGIQADANELIQQLQGIS